MVCSNSVCVCAKKSTCSCGAKPALECNCSKAPVENAAPTAGDACSCGKRTKSSCTCGMHGACDGTREGLQKQVIQLYRSSVRMAYKKPKDTREHWLKFVHDEFGKYKHIPKKQFGAIEHLIRVGDRRLEMYLNDQIKDIH